MNTTNVCLVYNPHVRENSIMEFISDLSSWQYSEYRNVSAKEFSFSDIHVVPSNLDVCSFVPANTGTIIKIHNRTHDSVFCRRAPNEEVVGINCLLSLYMEGKKPTCYDMIGNMSYTFWMYLGLRSIADAFFMTALCLLEGITLRTVQGMLSFHMFFSGFIFFSLTQCAFRANIFFSLQDVLFLSLINPS